MHTRSTFMISNEATDKHVHVLVLRINVYKSMALRWLYSTSLTYV